MNKIGWLDDSKTTDVARAFFVLNMVFGCFAQIGNSGGSEKIMSDVASFVNTPEFRTALIIVGEFSPILFEIQKMLANKTEKILDQDELFVE